MASTSKVPPPAERSRNWLELPEELTSSILLRLGAFEILINARKVCKTWRQICSDSKMWRVVKIRYPEYEKSLQTMKPILKKAVDLSCGQLVELHLEIMGRRDSLLRYVFERLSQLKRLYFLSTANTSNGKISEMLEKLPLLEELHLEGPCYLKKTIEIAGRFCPRLKSLKLINVLYICPQMGCDEDALAIAEHMPGLQHLVLYGPNKMTSDGLLAIFENCPCLESLQVWLNVANLGPDLVRRLSQQIKELRLSDSSEHHNLNTDFMNSLNFSYMDDSDDLSVIDSDDEIDNSDSWYEYDSSELSDSNNVSDDNDDSEVGGGSDGDSG